MKTTTLTFTVDQLELIQKALRTQTPDSKEAEDLQQETEMQSADALNQIQD